MSLTLNFRSIRGIARDFAAVLEKADARGEQHDPIEREVGRSFWRAPPERFRSGSAPDTIPTNATAANRDSHDWASSNKSGCRETSNLFRIHRPPNGPAPEDSMRNRAKTTHFAAGGQRQGFCGVTFRFGAGSQFSCIFLLRAIS